MCCENVSFFFVVWFVLFDCCTVIIIVENTPCVIYYFRSSKVDPVYIGDSVINTIADIILAGGGWWIGYLTFEYVDWWLTLIVIAVIQIISYFIGAGFLMITQRLIQATIGYCKGSDSNDTPQVVNNQSENP